MAMAARCDVCSMRTVMPRWLMREWPPISWDDARRRPSDGSSQAAGSGQLMSARPMRALSLAPQSVPPAVGVVLEPREIAWPRGGLRLATRPGSASGPADVVAHVISGSTARPRTTALQPYDVLGLEPRSARLEVKAPRPRDRNGSGRERPGSPSSSRAVRPMRSALARRDAQVSGQYWAAVSA